MAKKQVGIIIKKWFIEEKLNVKVSTPKGFEFVKEYIKKLLNDHKEFKEEIKEYAQSQLRTVQFKI